MEVLPGRRSSRGPPAASSAPATVRSRNQVIFDLPQELREKVVVGLNSSGQVREFQLRTRIRFRLRSTAQGRELIPETELLQQRDITFNEAAVWPRRRRKRCSTVTCRPTWCGSSCADSPP